MRSKKILIVFTDSHFSYSPSTLNLYHELRKTHDVKIIAPFPDKKFNNQKIDDPNVIYLDMLDDHFLALSERIRNKVQSIIGLKGDENLKLLSKKAKKIIQFIKKEDREIIAVDWKAMWFTQMAGKTAHLLSLEIKDSDIYYKLCKQESIQSVIIQSKERFDYLFKKEPFPPYFLVQNAPKNNPFDIEANNRKKNELIYCGSALSWFGIFSCLDFLMDYPDYKLTIKGAVPESTMQSIQKFYSVLLDTERLIIDSTFLSQPELDKFVSNFRIGFAFYDFYRFSEVRSFNYYTAPSGKVFQYLNSGVPIVANQLPGFDFIAKNNCGYLIPYLSSLQIKLAIDQIEKDYTNFTVEAKKISLENDFEKNIQGFIEFITNNPKFG